MRKHKGRMKHRGGPINTTMQAGRTKGRKRGGRR